MAKKENKWSGLRAFSERFCFPGEPGDPFARTEEAYPGEWGRILAAAKSLAPIERGRRGYLKLINDLSHWLSQRRKDDWETLPLSDVADMLEKAAPAPPPAKRKPRRPK
jgi:hypothetical protein